MSALSGIIPVLPTPFASTGEIDYASFGRAVDYAIESGASAVVMFGLASEYYKLDCAEHRQLRQAVVRSVAGRAPVIVSVTHHATEVAVRHAQQAIHDGADAVMILPPFFLNPAPQAIVDHIHDIAAAVHAPVVVQYAPAQTGIAPEVLGSLDVDYIKIDAYPSFCVPHIPTIVGYNGLDLPEAVSAGCVGCMPGVAMTRSFVRIWDLLRANPAEGRAMHARLLPLLQFMMQSVEMVIACEKRLLTMRGVLESSYSRRPRVALSTMQLSELDRLIAGVSELL